MAEKTAYHVLQTVATEEHGTVLNVVKTNVAAHNADDAIKQVALEVGTGRYVAVPSRSWRELPVTVEQQPIVKLGEAA